MKRITGILMALTMLISVMVFPVNVSAVEYVAVYLNERTIDFPTTDARPQIMNNRTYVPVRKTCEALGLQIDWNSRTETMTLTRDGITIAHTMRSKIVYVNGEAVTFDTPSINANNRILMPIRMIAESIGATVTWDNPTRSVHITTQTTAQTHSANVNDAVVNSVEASKIQDIDDGDTISITAVCTSSATSLKLVNTADNKEAASITEYTSNSDGTRTFKTDYKCENTTDSGIMVTLKAVPGIGTTFNESATAARNVSFMVNGSKSSSSKKDSDDYKSDYMLSCKLSSDEVKTNTNARVKVKTTSDVKRVRLTSEADKKTTVTSDYDEDKNGNRTFNCSIKMTEEGEWYIRVQLYVDGEYESAYEDLDVSVDDKYKESGSDDLEILDMWLNNDFAYKGYKTTLYVKTSTDVDYLELCTEDQDQGDGQVTHSTAEKYNTYYYWEFNFSVKHTGNMKFKLYAYNEDEESVSDTFSLEGRSVSKNEPAVLEIDQKTNSIIEGETAKFNITTTGCVSRIRISRGTSGSVYDEEVSTSSSTDKTHSIEFEVKDINADYYVTVYDDDDDFDRAMFKITGDAEEEIEIRDLDVEDDEIGYNDDVNITVRTSNSAYRVWVETSRGTQVSKIYKEPDDIDGTDYIWNINFSPIDTDTRQSFTVIAEDENKKTDEDSFRITIKK